MISTAAEGFGTRDITEGRARLILPNQERTRGPAHVFYNSRMGLNRDLAVLFASAYFPAGRQLHVCDAMTGSGVRATRYLLETPNVERVTAADNNGLAVEYARRNAVLNGMETRISVVESDASHLLMNHRSARFDIVDLDPFGSPVPFLECALRATRIGGALAVTATDMGPLTGARKAACIRKYGITPLRVEFQKEMALRILAAALAQAACRLELGVRFVFSHASYHYVRTYAAVMKGRANANSTAKSLGFLEYCSSCLSRQVRQTMDSIRLICEVCQRPTRVGGPIWVSGLWDAAVTRRMIALTPTIQSERLTELQNLLSLIAEEQSAPPFYYRTDYVSSWLRMKPAKISATIASLRDAGFSATRTHCHPNGFRTNASNIEIAAMMSG